jgi:hypothetical protein
VYVEYAFGWKELGLLLYMLMIMKVCRAEAVEIYGNWHTKFQAEI